MPVISNFFGILIKMYYRDHNPPHVHAKIQIATGIFSIESGKLLAGEVPHNLQFILRRWIQIHKSSLENWALARETKPF